MTLARGYMGPRGALYMDYALCDTVKGFCGMLGEIRVR